MNFNFDRVASIYDATRGLPEPVAEQVTQAIITNTHANPESQFLELGIGTGRIALPLLQRGYSLTGVDISRQMMNRLREKAQDAPGRLTLIEADVANLPIPDNSFDIVLAVHLLHLVPEWRKALTEMRRVLRPDGCFVLGGNSLPPDDPGTVIRQQWRSLVTAHGVPPRPRFGSWEEVLAELTSQGSYNAMYRAAQWTTEWRPIDLIDAQRARTFSESWDVPDDVVETVHEEMVAWARKEYGAIDRSIVSHGEFFVSVIRFPADA